MSPQPTSDVFPSWPPLEPAKTDVRTVLLYLAGVPVTAVVAVVARELVLGAWVACAETDAGNRFAGTFFMLSVVGVLGLVAYQIAVRLASRMPWLARFALGTLVVMIVGIGVMTTQVPYPGGNGSSGFADPEFPDCGPGLMPSWWPSWFPS